MNHLSPAYFNDDLQACLQQIEQKLQWGDSKEWKTQDFERLSEQIHQQTAVMMSSTTLKRVWGRVKYDSKPTLTTLDALAQFAGSENWRSFQQSLGASASVKKQRNGKRVIPWLVLLGLIIALTSIGLNWSLIQKAEATSPVSGVYQFSAQSVAEGLPNSVVFNYDAQAATPNAKVEIQQSWDETKRVSVERDKTVSTSIYYYPGFFRARLLVNENTVKTQGVLIPSEGWQGIVAGEPTPLYLDQDEIITSEGYAISANLLEEKGIDLLTTDPVQSRLYYIEEIPELRVSDFTMETQIQHRYKEGAYACQQVQVLIFCEGDVISIPLSIKGCIATNNLIALDQKVDGSTADLSGFGVDWQDWVKVSCKSKDGVLQFFINEELA
ncbi:MAG: hypothetical protein AAF242_21270, partial [Bacteroidota bacterium]